MFAAQAATSPEAAAIIFRGAVWSYARLAEQVERFSCELAGQGVGPGVLVGLCLGRTPWAIALMLATLRAGGAYLPLDRRYPAERLAYMLSDSGASVLIADCASPAWERFGGTVLELADGRLTPRACPARPAPTAPAELAYVIYTSGSTGAPKGVMLGHDATHLVTWARQAYSAQERSRVAATTSLCFDPSVFEIFTPLCAGGAVVLKEDALDPFATDERPTMFGTVPSVLRELCRADAIPPSVQVLNVGGEVLPGDLVREALRKRPGLTICNHYGPTEATTCVTVARLASDRVGEPPLGRPVRGAELLLLTPEGIPAPDGEPGEIHIGGPGLALGYLNRPELTAERFVTVAGKRLYRTGDLAVWRDGELHFAGRTDRQVKIRGFRVEPGEIEAVLLRDPNIDAAVVVVRDTASGPQLVAYVESRHQLTGEAVRQRLTASLPQYMVPARVSVLSALPRLVSGKVDHAALPDAFRPSPVVQLATRAERPIVHVFEEVLGRAGLGPNDSFFDMGGDSLAAVRAALRLEEILGHDLPAGLLHQAPTPRALAAALEHGRPRFESHLSLLQSGGGAPPLFCMADLFGRPFNYLSLARELGAEQAVYGVSPGPLQDAFTADGDVGRLTASFKSEVERVRPDGPYLIAGYSAGGLLAADLAGALRREGHAVRLVLLDSVLHSRRPTGAAVARWALRQAGGLLGPQKLATRIVGARALLRHVRGGLNPRRPPDWIPGAQIAFAARLIKVGASYRPATFGGPTLMVTAEDRDPIDQLFDEDGMSGWSGVLAGEVSRTTVAGGHHKFMREPNVAATARAVRQFLSATGGYRA